MASFYWEFGASPALALISGPQAKDWDRDCPWGAGRQEEIYTQVANEAVRQKAPGCRFELDLAGGVITIFQKEDPGRRPKHDRRPTSGLDAVAELPDDEVEELIELLVLEGMNGSAVEALGQIDHPRAQALVEEASRDRLSVDVRLAAAEALEARGHIPDLEPVLTREIRALVRPTDGLRRALRLAEAFPTPAVKQALLWASWNATECAPECARLLLTLVRGREAPESMSALLPKLGLHNSFFDRQAAFDALCREVGMTLDDAG